MNDTAISTGTSPSPITSAPHDNHVWSTATLPSKGRFYGDQVPEGKVQIRKWLAREVELLTSGGLTFQERIQRIINSCIKLPGGLKAGELLAVDRMAALLDQRILSYGPELIVTYKGRNGQPLKHTVDLNYLVCKGPEDKAAELEEKRLSAIERGDHERAERYVWENMEEPFPVRLPDAGDVVMLRFTRQTDLDWVMSQSRQNANLTGDGRDMSSTLLAMRRIVSIQGRDEMPLPRMKLYVQNLSSRDLNHIRLAIDAREPGYELTLTVPDGTGGDMEVMLPIDDSFLLPSEY